MLCNRSNVTEECLSKRSVVVTSTHRSYDNMRMRPNCHAADMPRGADTKPETTTEAH